LKGCADRLAAIRSMSPRGTPLGLSWQDEGAEWSADKANPFLGKVRNSPFLTQGSTAGRGMDLWRHLPG